MCDLLSRFCTIQKAAPKLQNVIHRIYFVSDTPGKLCKVADLCNRGLATFLVYQCWAPIALLWRYPSGGFQAAFEDDRAISPQPLGSGPMFG